MGCMCSTGRASCFSSQCGSPRSPAHSSAEQPSSFPTMPVEKDAANGLDKVVIKSAQVRAQGCSSPVQSPALGTVQLICTMCSPHTHRLSQGSTAEVYLHGAHVVSWKDPAGKVRRPPAGSAQRPSETQLVCHLSDGSSHSVSQPVQDILFCSKEAVFKPPKAIRCAAAEKKQWPEKGPGG